MKTNFRKLATNSIYWDNLNENKKSNSFNKPFIRIPSVQQLNILRQIVMTKGNINILNVSNLCPQRDIINLAVICLWKIWCIDYKVQTLHLLIIICFNLCTTLLSLKWPGIFLLTGIRIHMEFSISESSYFV